MFRVGGSQILTSYGTYSGDTVRGRLSYYPDRHGDRAIAGAMYTKVGVQEADAIPGLPLVVSNPGEQHYLVPRHAITTVYRPTDDVRTDGPVAEWLDRVRRDHGARAERVRVHGGRSLGSRSGASDTDMIVDSTDIGFWHDLITNDPDYADDVSDILPKCLRKYGHYGLDEDDMSLYCARKWHVFRLGGERASLGFVDAATRSDHLLAPGVGRDVTVRGRIRDAGGSYHLPVGFDVETDDGATVRVTAWPYLYLGSLRTGDVVEVRGFAHSEDGSQVSVQRRSDLIRVVEASDRTW